MIDKDYLAKICDARDIRSAPSARTQTFAPNVK